MTVSYENSKIIFQGIKAAGITSLSALPETWLGLLLQQAEKDPDVTMIQVAKEEEAIGIAAGAYFAGQPHVLLMQNHGFLAAINGIVSLAMLYGLPLCMLIALRGHWGEPYPWHTRGGIVTEGVLRALNIPFEYARDPKQAARQIRGAASGGSRWEARRVRRHALSGAGRHGRRDDHGRLRAGALRSRTPRQVFLPAARHGARIVHWPRAGAASAP